MVGRVSFIMQDSFLCTSWRVCSFRNTVTLILARKLKFLYMILHRKAEQNSHRTNPTIFSIINFNVNQSFLSISFFILILVCSVDVICNHDSFVLVVVDFRDVSKGITVYICCVFRAWWATTTNSSSRSNSSSSNNRTRRRGERADTTTSTVITTSNSSVLLGSSQKSGSNEKFAHLCFVPSLAFPK